MTCEEFQKDINRYLDGALGESLDAALLEHARHCQECAAYRHVLSSLDTDLRHLPAVHLSQDLLRRLAEIPNSPPRAKGKSAWKSELVRILAYGVPGAVMAFFIAEMPNEIQMLGNFLLAFAGIFVFTISLLRPIFLSPINAGEGR